ncbi:MAG: glycosyltransferase family 2 protein [Deltaproteobacteria bacterium]|nr:glycosyltransferase family 2 protein [Deltaproteobacteria bacterium]
MKPLISIIIVNWNGMKFLPECLKSIFSQTASFEVVLVDNGSRDGSAEYVKKGFPLVMVIEESENLGFAKGNNIGIAAAKGKYILTLNNDTMLEEGFLERLERAAESSDESIGMWAVKILSFDKKTIDSVGGLLIYRDGLAKGRGRLEKDTGQYDSPKEVFIPSACAGLYRKSMLDAIGAFDEDFFAYCEDTDLGLRARLAGFRTVNVPEAVVYHHYSGTTGRYTPRKAFLVGRNQIWLALKNLPCAMLPALPFYMGWRYFVQIYGVLAGKGAGGRFAEDFSKARLALILLKSYSSAFAGLPAVLKKRRAVQSIRKASDSEVTGWFRKFGLSASAVALID